MIGLVLQGGGARGSYQVGAVEALLRRNIKFDVVVGTSIGAINGALIASNEFEKLKKLWLSLDSKKIFGTSSYNNFTLNEFSENINDIKKIFNNKGIDITNFKELLVKNIDENKIRTSQIDYGLTTYCLTDNKMIETFKENIQKGKLSEYVLASSYLPIFKKEKIIDNKYYLDGGVFNNCPISMLDSKKFDKIYVIKIYRNNKIDKMMKKENVSIIAPNENLGSIINFDQKRTKYNFKLGYYDTLRELDNLDGNKYYIKFMKDDYYKKLFEKDIKKYILFETTMYDKVNEKKIILKIIEKLAAEYKIERFKVYTLLELILMLKIRMKNDKENKYYSFIKHIKLKTK